MSPDAGAAPPPWGGVLIGGAGRRMGRPKQLLRHRGVTLAERAVAAFAGTVEGVALLGAGEVPAALAALPRIDDASLGPGDEGAAAGGGPLAGMLAAMRWRPQAAWIFAPCDLTGIEPAAVAWLLGRRRPGRWAVLPRAAAGAPVEPLFALYEPPARKLLEELAAEPPSRRAPRRLADHPRVAVVEVPEELAHCWSGVNTPAEWAAARIEEGEGRGGSE